jgi:hypothetical protein
LAAYHHQPASLISVACLSFLYHVKEIQLSFMVMLLQMKDLKQETDLMACLLSLIPFGVDQAECKDAPVKCKSQWILQPLGVAPIHMHQPVWEKF